MIIMNTLNFKYLKEDRPPVPPTIWDAGVYWVESKNPDTNCTVNLSIDNEVYFITENENFVYPEDGELDKILSNLLDEWKIYEEIRNLRFQLPIGSERTYMYELLWEDIHNNIIPGKSGKFYEKCKDIMIKIIEKKNELR